MPLYEYHCQPCNGIFEHIRPMREASLPVPCPECSRDAPRIMSSFNAFTFRDGYPRRLPDKGTFWHMGKEVKRRAKRMRWYDHPETTPPKPKPRPTKGEQTVRREQVTTRAREITYRERWGIDAQGHRTVKARKPQRARRTLTP
jgi:putative FmdB family regulatory protein